MRACVRMCACVCVQVRMRVRVRVRVCVCVHSVLDCSYIAIYKRQANVVLLPVLPNWSKLLLESRNRV